MARTIAVNKDLFKSLGGRKKKKKDDTKHGDVQATVEDFAESKLEEEMKELYPAEEIVNIDRQLSSDGLDVSRQVAASMGLSAAAIHEYVPATRLKGRDDWVSESEQYSFYGDAQKESDGSEFQIESIPEKELRFPEHLKVYSFEPGNMSSFQEPKRGITGVLNYYLMNAASILPILALDLAPGDRFLDMCAAPGGKSIVALNTLYPELVVCNDLSRSKRLLKVLHDYMYNLDSKVTVTCMDGRDIDERDAYNKILVDVPCTNDRHSVIESDNNIFNNTRLKERIQLPQLQTQLLFSALKLVQVGGCVVYSTCTLSPIQNDGVVMMALRRIWEETDACFIVKDLKDALKPAGVFFRFAEGVGLKHGHLVIPYLPSNFGPIYFCKIVRTK